MAAGVSTSAALRRFAAVLLFGLLSCHAQAQALPAGPWPAPLVGLLDLAGVAPADTGPEPSQWAQSPTRSRQSPLYRAVMSRPLQAPYRVGVLAQQYRQASTSPHELMALAGATAGIQVFSAQEHLLQATQARLLGAQDPLASSMAWMLSADAGPPSAPFAVPDEATLPSPLRFEIALVLSSVGQAQQYLRRALAHMPPALTPALLQRQALEGSFMPFEEPDFRQLLPRIEREALLAGMLALTAAIERLEAFVRTQPSLPAVALTLDTPQGQIVIDTTGRDNVHRIRNALLVLDVGGNDDYEFLPGDRLHPIQILLDHQGNDRYTSLSTGTDPSSATMGYGLLWDTMGDDHYQGTQLAQGAALFGAAMLVDGGGRNRFDAQSHAQAHAIGGIAVLLGGDGDDQYTAQTQSQASAGPEGVAVLIDPAGDDRYTLDNTPLSWPSPQWPQVNTSIGQGAGYGIRAEASDGRSTTGGTGLLLDLAGNDHYTAQVFAQGTGYHEGLGALVDDDGNDQFEAVWYAMGAAAHRGAGLLLKRGMGHDSYRVSHATSLGAAHDFSVGILIDEGGNDHYALGDLGLGAAHDNSFALFVDAQGEDHYAVVAPACRAFGTAQISGWGDLRENLPNVGLFMDLGGSDHYPAGCHGPHNDGQWASPRLWPQWRLRSESGAGIDGDFPLPLPIRTFTKP